VGVVLVSKVDFSFLDPGDQVGVMYCFGLEFSWENEVMYAKNVIVMFDFLQ
jgi:hypothetical protein